MRISKLIPRNGAISLEIIIGYWAENFIFHWLIGWYWRIFQLMDTELVLEPLKGNNNFEDLWHQNLTPNLLSLPIVCLCVRMPRYLTVWSFTFAKWTNKNAWNMRLQGDELEKWQRKNRIEHSKMYWTNGNYFVGNFVLACKTAPFNLNWIVVFWAKKN